MRGFRECLKGLLKVARPQRSKLFVSCAVGLVRIPASMAFVWVCKALVDIATGVSDKPLPLYVGIMISLIVLQILSNLAASYWESLTIIIQKESLCNIF